MWLAGVGLGLGWWWLGRDESRGGREARAAGGGGSAHLVQRGREAWGAET